MSLEVDGFIYVSLSLFFFSSVSYEPAEELEIG